MNYLMVRAAVELTVLTTIDGRQVAVNPLYVVSVGEPSGSVMTFVDGIRCVVTMVDGKFIAALEDCSVVRAKLGLERRP